LLAIQGLILRILAGVLLTWTARDQQIKPRLSEVLWNLFKKEEATKVGTRPTTK
jgi:hypothetical protein